MCYISEQNFHIAFPYLAFEKQYIYDECAYLVCENNIYF